jgi:hypothetical protein
LLQQNLCNQCKAWVYRQQDHQYLQLALLDCTNADSHLKVFLERLFDLNISIYLSIYL